MGQLIDVSSPLHNQGRTDERNQVVDPDSQPEIIIFAHRETFVEPPNLFKQTFRQHNRRRTHQAKVEARPENIAGRFCVFGLRIYPHPVANPDFLGLANLNFRVSLHERHLDFQFFGEPNVVRI